MAQPTLVSIMTAGDFLILSMPPTSEKGAEVQGKRGLSGCAYCNLRSSSARSCFFFSCSSALTRLRVCTNGCSTRAWMLMFSNRSHSCTSSSEA